MNTALTNITIATTNATGIDSPSGLPGGVTASWSSNTTTISGTPNASGTFNYSIPILTGGFDISTATYVHSFSVAPQDTGPRELAFSSDGTKFFIVGFQGKDVNEYHMSTPWDVSTAIYDSKFGPSGLQSNTHSLAFSSDGTKMYTIGSGQAVWEYTLSTAWDVSTASFVVSFSIFSHVAAPRGLAFSNDGTKMFVLDDQSNTIEAYTLTTSFDISSASHSASMNVSSYDVDPRGIAFNSDGTRMFYHGIQNDNIHDFTLSTAYDISTASYNSALSLPSFDTRAEGIVFSNDGTKLFVSGNDGDVVIEYSLSSCTSVATGTITVNPDNTAGTPSSSPTLCNNTALTDITIATTGATGIGSASGLTWGVTASWSSDVITISGTPTASGTFSYTIPLSGGCGTVNATGTITVTESNTAGTIAGDESGCSGFDPATITSSSLPTGGSGSITYLWEYSTGSASGPWTTIAPPTGSPVTIPQELVINNSDDGFEYAGQTGTYATGGNNMRLGNRSGSGFGDTWVGMRFTTVPIPQGATINSAIFTVVAFNNQTNPNQARLKIYAEAVDNSTTFSTADNNFRNRSSTSAQVDWDISGWTYPGTHNSVDFSSVIQEIVNRPGWSTNNAINILIKDDGSTTGAHINIYQNNGSSSNVPKLDVSYSTVGDHTEVYDPSTITQTTWYRRGAYTCSPSSVVYTAAIEKTVTTNTAGTASTSPTLCINTALTDITIATTGATGIGSASGLPGGVTASWSSNDHYH